MWSAKEIKFLKENWELPDKILAKKLNRTKEAIRAKRRELGIIKPEHPNAWSKEEIEFLKKNWKLSDRILAEKLNRSRKSVEAKRIKMNLIKPMGGMDRYILPVDEIVRLYKQGFSSYQIAEKFNVSSDVIRCRLKKAGIKLRKTHSKIIKRKIADTLRGRIRPEIRGANHYKYKNIPKDILYIKYVIEKKPVYQIAKEFNTTEKTVHEKLRKLNLYRNRKWRKEDVLKELKRLADELGYSPTYSNCPSYLQNAIRRFGGINKLKKEIGLEIYRPIFNKNYEGGLKCDDGHIVSSSAEREIDNWLFHNGILHQVHKPIGYGNYKSDFYIPELNLHIEFWGLKGVKKYDKNIKKKHEIYHKLGLNLVDIYPNDNFREKLKFLLPLCSRYQTNLKQYYEKK